MRRAAVVSAAFLLAVNAVVLGRVAWNRAGEPDAVLELTERELPLGQAARESTGVHLRLRWEDDFVAEWFGERKLAELGFDCSPPLDARSIELHYERLLPRQAFVVLEYEGQAWERWLAQWREDMRELREQFERGDLASDEFEQQRESLEETLRSRSRLIAVDAGSDPRALRERYPDRRRYAIVPAVVSLRVERRKDEPPRLTGHIARILTDTIHVPREHARALRSLEPASSSALSGAPPRYTVTLAFGRRHEPWIRAVRVLEPGSSEAR